MRIKNYSYFLISDSIDLAFELKLLFAENFLRAIKAFVLRMNLMYIAEALKRKSFFKPNLSFK